MADKLLYNIKTAEMHSFSSFITFDGRVLAGQHVVGLTKDFSHFHYELNVIGVGGRGGGNHIPINGLIKNA